MKVLIFSDSHRKFNSMMKAIDRESPIDRIIHAGDVQRDVDDLGIVYNNIPIIAVKGNNDFWTADSPDERFFELGGVKIFLTHGHNFGVKYSYAKLWKYAEGLGADICIFGHTHKKYNERSGSVEMFNPGCASRSYGVLEIGENGYSLKICEI